MTYTDTYLARTRHIGTSKTEQAQNYGIRAFERRLADSPHRVELAREDGLHFSGIILLNKEDENKKTMELTVAVDIPLHVGNIILWKDGDELERWILYQKVRKANETYQTFYIVRCNYLLRWVNSAGSIDQSWCYLVSSMSSNIKSSYRTTNAVLSPTPNKYLEALIPDVTVDRGTRFVINEEGWVMIEYDNTSVPGIRYISLTEERINFLKDNVKENLANVDKIAQYVINSPEETQTFVKGEEVNPIFTITKNGLPSSEPVDLLSSNEEIVKWKDGKFMAVGTGDVDIVIRLHNYPALSNTIPCSIGEVKNFTAFIDGQDKLKLNRSAEFTLNGSITLAEGVAFGFQEPTDLATIVETDGNKCIVKANAQNKLGVVTLVATYNDVTYSKPITIVPLW